MFLSGFVFRFEEREAFETPVVFSVALHWRAWEFSDVIPFLDHVIQEFKCKGKQLQGFCAGSDFGPGLSVARSKVLCHVAGARTIEKAIIVH